VYQQAKTWGQRPSQLLGIDDPYTAFCVDEAVWMWGNHVESELNKATDGAKNKDQARSRLVAATRRLFTEEGEEGEKKGSFRDPALMLGGGKK